MFRIFLDTNVLIDAATQRMPWAVSANGILAASRDATHVKAYVASLSLKDVYYIATRAKSEPIARKAVNLLLESCEVVSVTRGMCEEALAGPEPDFEDGLIAAAADRCCADILITRDAAASKGLSIPKVAPDEFADFFLSESAYPDATEERWGVVRLPASESPVRVAPACSDAPHLGSCART